MGDFKQLKVWKLARELAVAIYQITGDSPFQKDFGLRDQMRRSAISVSSNIAEGDNLDTNRQSIKHFYIARGSVAELQTQLLISYDIGYINDLKLAELENQCEMVSAMLTGLIRYRSK